MWWLRRIGFRAENRYQVDIPGEPEPIFFVPDMKDVTTTSPGPELSALEQVSLQCV